MILKNLLIGSKVREPKSSLVFLIADHNHTACEGTSLVTDCAVKYASFDAIEPDNPDEGIKESGNNYYPISNIHQWLNSNEVDWYRPSNEFDTPPLPENIDQGRQDFYEVPFYSTESKFTGDFSYKKDPGFLTWFSKEFVDSIYESKVPCYGKPVPGEVHYGPPPPFELKAKAFLLSAPEIGFEKAKTCDEGFRFRLFNDARMHIVAPTPAAIGKPEGYVYDDCSFWYWLRTPMPGSTTAAMVYNSGHRFGDFIGTPVGGLPVRLTSGIRPALNIDSGVKVSEETDANGIHTLLLGGK
jgi:hypothetical protein